MAMRDMDDCLIHCGFYAFHYCFNRFDTGIEMLFGLFHKLFVLF